MAGLKETWSNIEVRSVIRFLRLKGTHHPLKYIAILLRCTMLTSCHGNTFGFDALPLITAGHTANRTDELLGRYNGEVLDHLPYGPDLAPSDFNLFGPLKKPLGGRWFATDREVQQAVMSWLQTLDKDFFHAEWDRCLGVPVGQMLRQVWGLCGKVICTKDVLLIIRVYVIWIHLRNERTCYLIYWTALVITT
jgi:hypothetical protein